MGQPVRKRTRLSGYDYSTPGYYFITVCALNHRHLFWAHTSEFDVGASCARPAPDALSAPVGASCARPPLSKYGQIAFEELLHLSHIYPNVTVDKFVVMPNHIHMILVLKADQTGRAQLAPTVPHILQQFKGAASKRAGLPLWQKGYHDHIIRNDADYRRIWQYIDTNPAKWQEDCYYKDGVAP